MPPSPTDRNRVLEAAHQHFPDRSIEIVPPVVVAEGEALNEVEGWGVYVSDPSVGEYDPDQVFYLAVFHSDGTITFARRGAENGR